MSLLEEEPSAPWSAAGEASEDAIMRMFGALDPQRQRATMQMLQGRDSSLTIVIPGMDNAMLEAAAAADHEELAAFTPRSQQLSSHPSSPRVFTPEGSSTQLYSSRKQAVKRVRSGKRLQSGRPERRGVLQLSLGP